MARSGGPSDGIGGYVTVPAEAARPADGKAKQRRPSASRERFERLYRTIRDRICLFEYPPGGRLSEEELAKEFSTSRTPVRRVLARLEADGLIEARHSVGHFVTSFQLDELMQLDSCAWS